MTIPRKLIGVASALVLTMGLVGCGSDKPADPPADPPAETSAAAPAPETTQAEAPGTSVDPPADEVTTEIEGEGPVTVDAGSMIFTVPDGAKYVVDDGYYVDDSQNIFVEAEVKNMPGNCAFDLNRTKAGSHDEHVAEWRTNYAAKFTDDEFIDQGQQTINGQLYDVIFQKGNVKRMWYIGWLETANPDYSGNIRIYCHANDDGTLASPEPMNALLESISYVDKEAEMG